MSDFQVMPPPTADQVTALREDIEKNGVIVPIVVDQHGRVIDGHNRMNIARRLGVECPTEVRHVADDDQARDLAVTLNCARRHLTREQVRAVITAEAARRPDDSDRAIARRVGCSPSTVSAVRRPQVSNLDTDTMTEAEAHELSRLENGIDDNLTKAREHLAAVVMAALSNRITAADILLALTRGQREHERTADPVVADVFRAAVFDPVIDALLDPAIEDSWRTQWDHETFEPWTETERLDVLEAITRIGAGRSAVAG